MGQSLGINGGESWGDTQRGNGAAHLRRSSVCVDQGGAVKSDIPYLEKKPHRKY